MPRLRMVLQVERQIVFVGALIIAFFAVLKLNVPLGFMAVCILAVGNLMAFLQILPSRWLDKLERPWKWMAYLAILTAASLASAVCAAALLKWMVVPDRSLEALLRETWQVSVFVAMATGIVGFVIGEIQYNLQKKNQQLQQAVERGNVALHQQEQELNRALEIQRDLLPKEFPRIAGIEMAGVWQPARTVGGDYFDVIRLDERRLGICVGDVAGKGLTACLLMANLQAAFRAYATAEASPAAVCAKLNGFVCGNVAPGKFITFFYGILDAERKMLTYENAGHCPAVLVKAVGPPEWLQGHGGVLGVMPEWQYADSSVKLTPGDRLVIYTDGVAEAENTAAEEFGSERIAACAKDGTGSATECKARVMEAVTKFCGGQFRDDVTLLVAAIR